MKTAEWARLARKFVLPNLPGQWVLHSNHAMRLPNRHLAWVITFQLTPGGFTLDSIVMPQFVYTDVLARSVASRTLGAQPHGRLFENREAALIMADPEQQMPALRDLVLQDGIPHLSATGSSVELYLHQLQAFAASRPYGHGTVHTEHETAAAALLLGDLTTARTAYQNLLAAALPVRRPHPPWLRDLVSTAEQRLDLDDAGLTAVRDQLHDVEDKMRQRWKLPEPEQTSPDAGLR